MRGCRIVTAIAGFFLLSGCTMVSGPRTGPDWLVWGCGAVGLVVLLLSVPVVLRRGFLRFLLHLTVTALLTCATVWIIMHAAKEIEGRAVICLLSLGVFIIWTIWAISGFAVGNRPPNDDDDSFLPL